MCTRRRRCRKSHRSRGTAPIEESQSLLNLDDDEAGAIPRGQFHGVLLG